MRHDKLNILSLEAALVDLLTIILLLILLGLDLGGLALAKVVLVVVTGVVTGSLGGSELLGGGSLGLGVQVLDLGLTEDAKERLESNIQMWRWWQWAHTSRCCWRGSGRHRAG